MFISRFAVLEHASCLNLSACQPYWLRQGGKMWKKMLPSPWGNVVLYPTKELYFSLFWQQHYYFAWHFFSSWWYTNIPSLIKKIEVGQKISSRQNLDTQMHSTHGHSDLNTPTKLCYSGYKYYNNNVLYSTSTAIIWAFNAVQINKCNRTHISMLLKLA